MSVLELEFTCPVCNKTQLVDRYPAPQDDPLWVYRDRSGNAVCSYQCYLKALSRKEEKGGNA